MQAGRELKVKVILSRPFHQIPLVKVGKLETLEFAVEDLAQVTEYNDIKARLRRL